MRHRFAGRLFHHFLAERRHGAVLGMTNRDEQVRVVLWEIYEVDRVVRGPLLGFLFGCGRLVSEEVRLASKLDEFEFLRSEPLLDLRDGSLEAFNLDPSQV